MKHYDQLMCCGGPWHGRRVRVNHGNSVLIPKESVPIVLEPTDFHPYALVPNTLTGVYKREQIALESGDGIELRVTVLAYYGTEPADRPKDFHL